MKKVLLGLALTGVLGASVCCGNIKPHNLYAEGSEPVTSELESSEPVSSEPVTSETENASSESESEIPTSSETPTDTETSENTDVVVPTPDEIKDWGEKLLEKWLSPETIALITTWAGTIVALIVAVARSVKNKRLQVMTAREVKDEVIKSLEPTVRQAVEQYAPELLNSVNTVTSVLETFAKVLALSQENTPESRVAIINLLSEIGMLKQETAEETKKVIAEQEQVKQENNDKVDEELDKIIDDGTSC